MSDAEWDRLRELADGHDDPAGGFIAMRGFEWTASIPETGHMNVWFSSDWTDPIATASAGSGGGSQFFGAGLAEEVGENAPVGGELFGEAGHALAAQGGRLERDNPANVAAMAGMYRWLQQDPGTPVVGGGSDAIAGFNHPGREPGRFGHFHFDPAVLPQLVSVEVFNRRDDYLFEGIDYGNPSPISQCLDAGWKVGLNGVTDEHGTDWGSPRDKGRCGLWVPEFSRAGVRRAMAERRFFATNRRGFRLDVLAEDTRTGATALMGQDLASDGTAVRFVLDIDGNDAADGIDDFRGRMLNAQVCVTGGPMPAVVETFPFRVPDEGGSAPLPVVDLAGSPWAFVRICDPQRPEDAKARLPVAAAFRGVGGAIAYGSPVFLVG